MQRHLTTEGTEDMGKWGLEGPETTAGKDVEQKHTKNMKNHLLSISSPCPNLPDWTWKVCPNTRSRRGRRARRPSRLCPGPALEEPELETTNADRLWICCRSLIYIFDLHLHSLLIQNHQPSRWVCVTYGTPNLMLRKDQFPR